MPARVTIFNHYGNALAELSTNPTYSWILDDYGRAQFELATFTDVNCTRTNLQYGNFVLIQHLPTKDALGNIRGKLPDWLGVIVPPQEWQYGLITVTAYSVEYLLKTRPVTPNTLIGSPGNIFGQMLQDTNNLGVFPIALGSIYDDGTSQALPVSLAMYDEVKNLSANTQQDWDITWTTNNGQLHLYGNWYFQKGVVVNAVFSEGIHGNMKLPRLTEQGTIYNKIVGRNMANSTTTRLSSLFTGALSISDYGIFAASPVFNVQDQAGLDAATIAYRNTYYRPVITLELVALDSGLTFTNLATGNVWDVVLKSVGFYAGKIGFQGSVRLAGMEYDTMSDEITLATQTLTGDLTRDNYA